MFVVPARQSHLSFFFDPKGKRVARLIQISFNMWSTVRSGPHYKHLDPLNFYDSKSIKIKRKKWRNQHTDFRLPFQSSLPSTSNGFFDLIHHVPVNLGYFMALFSKLTLWSVNWTFCEKMTGKKGNCFFVVVLRLRDSSFFHLDLYPFQTKQS